MPPARRSTVDQVADRLRREIEAGTWPVGARIPPEPDLAAFTGVGRNTVREAVGALVHAGMLARRQGSGTYVVAASDVRATVGRFLAGSRARDVLELRQALDVTAATLAARRRTEDDVRTLRDIRDRRARCWDSDRETALALDTALHRAIVAASHNAVYLEFYDLALPTIEESVTRHVAETRRGFHDEHAALVEAVIEGDPENAAAAARRLFVELSAHSPG
ncbi:FadR/GntR family transcriptional regulator [Rhodococcoides corynebacterioides]|uniref:FadR family transcriptional regulator n=1 Tax=Rhodococcoides corynebacterioides TaxID=53972 RepID=A0ABS7P0L7_9NOCA|nr:FCD domain-containing protein [Rhodococcus corynebacterioides]MBY6365940.1 FadR family transcriptional regulator [Rhodococcus corynebacterioides]MBY6408583.1 FadR family transcriptional regulator [Rhodococcus corynebacterioides]